MKYQRILSIALISMVGASSQALTALDWTSNTNSATGTTSTRGYVFDVIDSAGINVTHLTVFDEQANGLSDSHAVGIWNSAGTLLVSAVVSAGVADPLNPTGKFRMAAVSTTFLAAGTNYRVGAVYLSGTNDFQAASLTGITTPTEIRYITGAFINNGVNALTNPTSTLANGIPGGSFEFQAVPEPATMTVLGLAGFAALRKRRSR